MPDVRREELVDVTKKGGRSNEEEIYKNLSIKKLSANKT